jgi:hypothetical protein
MTDIRCDNHGSIVIVYATSDAGVTWLTEHLNAQAMRWGQLGFAVEPRYVDAILEGAADDGLTVGHER